MNLKDKVVTAICGIFRPSRLLDAGRFPWISALAVIALVTALGFLEPLPDGIGMSFTTGYLLLMAGAGLLGWIGAGFWAWLLARSFGVKAPLGGLVRLALGASSICIWTFPLAFLMRSPGASAGLSLLREFGFALSFAAGSAGLLPSRRKKALWTVLLLILLPCWSIGMELIPELSSLSHLHVRNPGTGLVAPPSGTVPESPMPVATWTLYGRPGPSLEAARVALGTRQIVKEASPGKLVVTVTPGVSAGDTETLIRPSPAAVSLVAVIPAGEPHQQLLALHALVQSRVRYERKFFPGDVHNILERGSGDCKAFAQVFAEGAAALGFPARVVRGLLARPDGFWAHAWVSVQVNGRWEEWDPTSPVPAPDARYLRFSPPAKASSVFEGELAIFALDSLHIEPR